MQRYFIPFVSVTLCLLDMDFLWKLEDMQGCACGLKHEVGRIGRGVSHRALGRKQITYLAENKRLTNMRLNVFSEESNYIF